MEGVTQDDHSIDVRNWLALVEDVFFINYP